MLISINPALLRKLNAIRRQNGEPEIARQFVAQLVVENLIQSAFEASGAPTDPWGNPIDPSAIIKTVSFVYDKSANAWDKNLKWRTVQVTEDTREYIQGYDVDDGFKFKKFLKSKIFGGKIIVLS